MGREKHQLPRIKTNYFGETKPISDNSTSEGRQKNRRVAFVISFE